MATYTIRPGFSITLDGLIYIGGDEVELSDLEFQLNKHKLEGVESTVLPIESIGKSNKADSIVFDDSNADLIEGVSEAVLQDVIEKLDERLDKVGFVKEKLTENRKYFVATDGDDNNSGLSSSDAFATPEKVIELLENSISLNGFRITIAFADGTYNIGIFSYLIGDNFAAEGSSLTFESNSGDAEKVILKSSSTFSSTVLLLLNVQTLQVRFQNLTFSGTVSLNNCQNISFRSCVLYNQDSLRFSWLSLNKCKSIEIVKFKIKANPEGSSPLKSFITLDENSFNSIVNLIEFESNDVFSGSLFEVKNHSSLIVSSTFRLNGSIFSGENSENASFRKFSITDHSSISGADNLDSIPGREGSIDASSTYGDYEFINPNYKNTQEAIGYLESLYDTYKSPTLNYINGAEIVFAHGWDEFDPTTDWYQVSAWAVCTQDQNGWTVGERVRISRRATVSIDATNIYLQIGNNGISITRKNGNLNEFNLNSSNWEIYVQGVRRN